jgi:hypothetical protein
VKEKQQETKKKKKIFTLKVFEMMSHEALSNFRLRFEPSSLPPLNIISTKSSYKNRPILIIIIIIMIIIT